MATLRDRMNDNPAIVAAIVGVAALVAIGIGAWLAFGGGSTVTDADDRSAFYSTDDGNTWFKDDASRLPPFDHDGKAAVAAFVYRCEGHEFANHLERYTDEGKEAATKIRSTQGRPDGRMLALVNGAGREFKRPADAGWTRGDDRGAVAAIQTPQCPEGHDARLVAIIP